MSSASRRYTTQKKNFRSTRTDATRRNALNVEQLEDRRVLATLVVTLASDALNPSGTDQGVTLREAISYVNGDPVPLGDQTRFDYANLGTNDKIVFDSSVFGPNGTTNRIELLHGELAITKSVIIDGSGYDVTTQTADNTVGWQNLTIDANQNGRIFAITDSASQSTTIRELSLTPL